MRGLDAYIIGPPYSGSTLLGNALNGHPQVFHSGEVSRLPAFGVGPPATECMLCRVLDRACPVWDHGLVDRIAAGPPAASVGLIREVTGAPTIVDSSKHVEWLRRVMRRSDDSDVRVILTLRRPYAFAASVRRTDGMPPWQAANMWRDTVYDALRELGRQGIPFMIVRYEEFASLPERSLRRICSFLGLEFDTRCLRFWEVASHALGGNPHAYVWYPDYVERVSFESEFAADRATAEDFSARRFGGWADVRWRSELSADDMREVRSTPLLADLVELVGYDLDPSSEPAQPAAPLRATS